ncbi:MAG: TonB-dependent receptor [Burkholderiales bacterium]|nr:TonB-dependent receptor [Burkholderiales bacterium]
MFFKEKIGVQSVRLAISVFAGSLIASTYVHAETAAVPAKIQKIEITGSNIKRIDKETASPVQVISRAELEKSGATSLSAVIQNLSSNNAGSLSGVDYNGFSPGATTASLRGLGSGATLVLVNGRRIAQYGITGFQSQFANLDSIPVGAVDHIDILLDGASAIYGSEAIAGVINVWLRKDYTGGDVKVSGGATSKGKGQTKDFNLSYGQGEIAADKYNVMATYEHHDSDALSMRDINAYNSQDYRGFGITKGDRRSAYSVPGNVFGATGWKALPGCTAANLAPNGRCLIDRFDWIDATPKNTRDSAFARAVYEINANHSAFLEAGVTQIKTNLRYEPQFYYNTPTGVTNAGGKSYLFRAGDIGARGFDVKDTETRIIAGLKGGLGNWDYDSAVGFLQSKVTVDSRGLILVDKMEAALANGSYVPGLTNAGSVIARISPALQRAGTNKSTFADFKASNSELFELPGGSAGMAVGLEYRRESTSDIDDGNFGAENVFGFGGLPKLPMTTRNTSSAYAELTMPVLKSLELSAAARADRYSVGGNSVTPKIGAKWNALPTLVLRGTIAKGFRAPNFREISPTVSVGFYNGLQDPLLCKTGDEPDCNLSIQANISGNSDLKPEKSTSNTVGLVWEPVKDYSVSLDYYKIERRDEISSLDVTYLLSNQRDPNFSKFITRDSGGHITQISLPYINIGKTAVSGFDLDFKGKQNLGENGKLNFRSKLSLTREYLVTPFPDSPTVDYNKTYSQPEFRGSLAVGWEKGAWSHEVSTSYISGYDYVGTPAETCNIKAIYGAPTDYCRVAATNTWGWFTGYKGFKNVELSLNISNLLDARPPFDARSALANVSFPYNTTYNNPFGRRFQLTAKYTFK